MQRRAILAAIALSAMTPLVAEASGGDKAEKKKGGGATYLQIQAMSATMNATGARRGILTVEAGVDIPDDKLRGLAEKSLPRLRAAYVQVLQAYAASLPPRTPPNPEFIGTELQRETDRVLGKKGARLLLGAILVS
jgi:hypothetical protein